MNTILPIGGSAKTGGVKGIVAVREGVGLVAEGVKLVAEGKPAAIVGNGSSGEVSIVANGVIGVSNSSTRAVRVIAPRGSTLSRQYIALIRQSTHSRIILPPLARMIKYVRRSRDF